MARILCAPDKFKGTLTAPEAAAAMCRGAERAGGQVSAEECAVADGGEGTLDVLLRAPHYADYKVHVVPVTGPLGERVSSAYAIGPSHKQDHGIIELAQAAGLTLVAALKRDPTATTTFGVGETIQHAINAGATTIVVAVGGSATVDGGCGIAQALGVKFFDDAGRELTQPMTGSMLRRIARIERPRKMPELVVLCDVMNPVLGEHGAARTFAPQKGATLEQVEELEQGLARFAAIAGGDISMPGTGAAGGAAFGLMSLCGAKLLRGIEYVLHELDFARRSESCDLVLTGEGRLDRQSLHGKACMGVARAAHEHGVPTIAIVGSTGPGAESCTSPAKGGWLHSSVSLADEFGEERALRDTAALIEQVAERVVRDWKSRKGLV